MPVSSYRCQLLLWLCCWLLANTSVSAARCKPPYVRVQSNYCYYVEQEQLHTSFNDFCYGEKRTSRVCLDNVEEMRALALHLYALGFDDGAQFWSAGSRWPGDRQFYWNYFGRARALNFSNWMPDEPTTRMGRNCLLLTLSNDELVMSSESCYTQAVDICEMKLSTEPEVIH